MVGVVKPYILKPKREAIMIPFFLLRESDNDILAEQNLNIKGLIVIMEC